MKNIILFILLFFKCFVLNAQSKSYNQCNDLIQKGAIALHNNDYVNAFSYLDQAQLVLNSQPNYKQQFLILNNIGLIYLKMHDYKEAINYLHQSYELAINNNEAVDEMTVLNNMAIVYSKLNKYPEAEKYFLHSYQLAKQQKLDSHVGMYAINLANLYYDLKKYDDAEQYLLVADEKNPKGSRNFINTNLMKNAIRIEKNQVDLVISSINDLLIPIKKNKYSSEQVEALLLLARAYKLKENWSFANSLLDEALLISNDNEVRQNLYEEKALNSFYLGNLTDIVSAKDSVISLNKKISEVNSKELLENASLKFELSKSNYDLEIQKIDKKNQNRMYLLIFVLLLFSSGFIIYIYYKRNILNHQKKIIAENDLKIKKLELEQEINHRLDLEQDFKEKVLSADQDLKKQQETALYLKEEIDLKNQQLSDKVLFQSTRNELLQSLLSELNESTENRNLQKINQVTQQLKLHLKEDVKWDDFNHRFENINNHFLKKLNHFHPDLNANDIRFLSFVYLNLTTKEIANLLHITPESCRKRKERLRVKLKIDREVDLYQYLTSIDI